MASTICPSTPRRRILFHSDVQPGIDAKQIKNPNEHCNKNHTHDQSPKPGMDRYRKTGQHVDQKTHNDQD